MHAPLLRTQQLTVSYGGVRAVDSVDVAVEPGRLVGLIGPNGAGKTTFIDAVSGFTPSAGQVLLDGQELNRLSAHRRARRGLGRTWQGEELFDDLSVYDNVRVACERLKLGSSVVDFLWPRRRRSVPAADVALERLGLHHLGHRFPAELSLAHRKLVGVARALAAEPKLLCLDEPAAGLATAESRELGERLRAIVATGVGIVLVDHDMGLVLSVCDEVYVMESGRVIARGTPAQVRWDPRVIASYLGERESTSSRSEVGT
jgi:branched-chain amino acid transport system ATP-binding protein